MRIFCQIVVVMFCFIEFQSSLFAQQGNVESLLVKAKEHLSNQEYDEAIGVALFGLKASENNKDQLSVLNFEGILGQAYINKKDYKNAIRYYVQYTNTAEKSNLDEQYGDGLYSLGHLYKNMMAYQKASDYFEEALIAYNKENKSDKIAITAETLGEIYELTSDVNKELESFEILRNLGYQINHKGYTLKAVRKLEKLYVESGNLKDPLDDYKKLLSFNLSNDEKAEVNYKLSRLSLIRDDNRRSLYYAKQATKYQPGEVDVNLQAGIAMLANKQYNEAQNQFKLSLDLSEDLTDYKGMVQSNVYLAQLSILFEDYRNAQNYLSIAEKIAIKNSLLKELHETYEQYVVLYEARKSKAAVKSYGEKLSEVKRQLEQSSNSKTFSADEMKKAEVLANKLEQEIQVEIAERERKKLALEQSQLLRASEEQKVNLLKQEQEIQKQQLEKNKLEAEKTAQNLLITQQELEAEQRRAELDRLEKESKLRELTEMENKRRLELAENEKLLLDQQTKLQAADIESAEQAKKYLFIIVAIAFLALILLLYLLARINRTKKLIAKQNEDLEEQQTKLKASQERLQNTLEEQVRAKNNLEKLNLQLKNTQSQLIHAEKMSSLGQLTAGIAHEVNNPIGFVKGGVQSLKLSIDDMIRYLDQVSTLDLSSESTLQTIQEIQESYNEEKEEIHEICDQLVADILFGATRIEEIVNGLRVFSRHEEAEKKFSDLHENLDSALLILRNKIKNKTVIKKDFDEKIEDIECFPGQLNQVFVNLVGNAVDAIEPNGQIVITTSESEDQVFVSIKDNGKGIPEDIQSRIFEPFYTTKDVGEGTGLGLSISYSIIEEHGGNIAVKSEVGKGTEFLITLNKILIKK